MSKAARRPTYTEEVRGIFTIPLYDKQSCEKMIAQVESSPDWGSAKVSVEEDEGYGDAVETETRRASALGDASCPKIIRDFDKKVDRIVKPLVRELWGVTLQEHTGTHLVRYSKGNFYTPHTDAALDVSDRFFTVLCYLNGDFSGGQTSFPDLGYNVEPSAGKAVIFPSTYLHSSEPVTKGLKYVLVTWLMGSEPLPWI